MAPSIVLDELSSRRHLRVLDPMAGSGTTIAVAKRAGHTAIGFDTDPLAVLLAQGWCAEVDEDKVRRIAAQTLSAAEQIAAELAGADAYPCGREDQETRAFTRYWFDANNRRQLVALAHAIRRRHDPTTRTVLWCAFSRMIIAKTASVSLAIDIPHSRPRRVRERSTVRAFERFLPAVETVLAAAPFKGSRSAGSASVQIGDARLLPLADASVDLVVTSPPYLNAIDYLRCSKFALVWMGSSIGDLRRIRASSIGTEVGLRGKPNPATDAIVATMTDSNELPSAETAMLKRYIGDMRCVLGEVARVLVRGGGATLVVGDSTIRGIFVRNSVAVRLLGEESGLTFESAVSRRLPDNLRYMPPPKSRTGTFEARMRTEVVVKLRRPKNGPQRTAVAGRRPGHSGSE